MLVTEHLRVGSRLLLSGLLLALSLPSIQAQSSEPAEPDPGKQEQTPTKVPNIETEITVTATRTETPLRSVGQSVSIISEEEIEALGATTIQEVLRTIPGFTVTQSGADGGITSLFVRGGESDFTLVMIDGVQINQPGGAIDLADLGTSNVERIEVVRGPSSVLYGSDAVSATVNIITKQGTSARPSGKFGLQGGSFGTLQTRGNVAGGNDRVHYSLGGFWSASDGFYEFNNQYHRGEGSANFSFALGESSTLSASTRFINADYEFPTDATGAVVDPNDFRKTTQAVHTISYQSRLNERLGTRLQYGYQRRKFGNFTIADQVSDFFDSTFTAEEDRHYLDWQNNLRINSSNLLTGGLSFERESSLSKSLNRHSLGVYLQNQYSLQNKFFLTTGIRLDSNNRFQDFVTGSVSIAYLPHPNWKLRGSFGNGFRSPSFAEIVGFPEFGITGNPDLSPEKNVAFDFGVDFFSGPLFLSGTVFFNRYTDLIEFSFLSVPGNPNYLNLEKADAQGLELEASVPFGSSFRLGGNYTFLETQVRDSGLNGGDTFLEGEELLRRPRHAALLYGQYTRHRLSLRTDVRFKGQRDDIQFFQDFSSQRVRLPSYLIVDLSLRFPLIPLSNDRGDVALLLQGRNLFDREYTEVAGFQSPGRSLLAGLEIGFH